MEYKCLPEVIKIKIIHYIFYGYTCVKTLEEHSEKVKSVAIHGENIISSAGANFSWDNIIKIWKLDGECVKTLEVNSYPILSLAIHKDFIISGSEDKTDRKSVV